MPIVIVIFFFFFVVVVRGSLGDCTVSRRTERAGRLAVVNVRTQERPLWRVNAAELEWGSAPMTDVSGASRDRTSEA
jgi:hypothetical protein